MLSNGTETRYKLKISGKQTTIGAADNKHTKLQQAGWVGASEIYLGQQMHTPDSAKATARQEAELRGQCLKSIIHLHISTNLVENHNPILFLHASTF